MKYLILCLILIVPFSLSEESCKDLEPASVDNCKKYNLTDEERETDEYGFNPDSCCYLTGDTDIVEVPMCSRFQKNKVDDYIKSFKNGTDKKVSIDCSGKFLSLASAFFFLVLLV